MIRAIDVPWWGRPLLAAALAQAVGLVATLSHNTSPETRLYLSLPVLVAGNVALADLGRRRLSIPFTLGAALGALAATACFAHIGAALLSIVGGGVIARRLVRAGKLRRARRNLLFVIGAATGPLATIGSWKIVEHTRPGNQLAIALAAFHLLYWLPVAGAEATLAWSAARSRPLSRAQGSDTMGGP